MKGVFVEVRRSGAVTRILHVGTRPTEWETRHTNSAWRGILAFHLIRWILGSLCAVHLDGMSQITMSCTRVIPTGER